MNSTTALLAEVFFNTRTLHTYMHNNEITWIHTHIHTYELAYRLLTLNVGMFPKSSWSCDKVTIWLGTWRMGTTGGRPPSYIHTYIHVLHPWNLKKLFTIKGHYISGSWYVRLRESWVVSRYFQSEINGLTRREQNSSVELTGWVSRAGIACKMSLEK